MQSRNIEDNGTVIQSLAIPEQLPGTNKVQAIKVLLKYLSAAGDDTLAFGDAESDRLMLEYCNTGIAMGNAQDSVKLSADYVTGDVDSGGLFHAFARFNLI